MKHKWKRLFLPKEAFEAAASGTSKRGKFIPIDKSSDTTTTSTVTTLPIGSSDTTVPETTLPETTLPETTQPETTVPETTLQKQQQNHSQIGNILL